MTMRDDQPLRGTDLAAGYFNCCPNADPRPYKCSECGLPHVFCAECDTVYSSLPDTSRYHPDVNHFDSRQPSHRCLRCGHAFEYAFLRNASYGVTLREWRSAGLEALLLETE